MGCNGGDGRNNDPNHWGGAGGNGGGASLSFTGGSVISTGAGIYLPAFDGNGGLAACDCYFGNSGFGGHGGSVWATIAAGDKIQIQIGYALAADVHGGNGAAAAQRGGAPHNPRGGNGGSAGTITIEHKSGDIISLNGSGLFLRAQGGSGGGGRGNGSHPSGNGGAGGMITLKADEGSITANGHGSLGIHVNANGGSGGSAVPGFTTPGGSGAKGGNIYIVTGPTYAITTVGESADGIYAVSQGGDGGNGGDGHVFGPSGKPGGNGGDSGSITINNYGSITTEGAISSGMNGVLQGGVGGSGGADDGIIYSHGGDAGRGGSEADLSVWNLGGAIET